MVRKIASRPILAIIVAAIWTAAVLGFTMAQEIPVSIVKGRVVSSETGRPISGASVVLYRTDGSEEDQSQFVSAETDENGKFQMRDLPVGNYEVEAHGEAHSLKSKKISVHEGRIRKLNLKLQPAEPYLNMYIHQHMFTTKEQPQMVLDGFTRGGKIEVVVRKVNIDAFLSGKSSSLYALIDNEWSPRSEDKLSTNPNLEIVQKTTVDVSTRDSEGVYHEKPAFQPMQPGIYVITASVDDIRRSNWLSVSDISLITKDSAQDILAYVVKLDTGEPISGAEVKVLQGAKTIGEGVTDATGLWRGTTAAEGDDRSRLIIARKGDSIAFLNSYSYGSGSDSISIYTYTDRPVYRPDQEVCFKGIVRKFKGDGYSVPTQGEAEINVTDRWNSVIYKGTLPLSRFGSFHGSFKLPKYAATGGYDVTVNYSGRTKTTWFSVAEYRKPEFSVKVEMPKKRCVRGERIKAKVKADYYFGAPVPGAQVNYTVSRSEYWFWPDDEDSDYYEWDYEDYGGYGETVAEGVTKTGPDGTAEIEFTAKWDDPKESYYASDQQFTVTAYVTDGSSREAEGDASIVATQGAFKVILESDSYVVAPHQNVRVKVLATDYDNKPQPGIEMEVSASRTHWKHNHETYEKVMSKTLQTNSKGVGYFYFKPDRSGSYTIRTSCTDRKGNKIKSSEWLWVSGESEDYSGYSYPDLEIVLDKKVYEPGDTAKVLINSKEEGAMALVTVEGRQLFDYKTVKLTSKSTLVEVPIKPEYRPNFFIDVCYVKNKKFITQEARAIVSLKEKSLQITVTPDKKRYEPGEKATYLIRTVDSNGKPLQAEVSLGVVDEAIYAIQEDDTTPIRDFFYERQWNSVNTRFSFPDIYLSGDKAGYAGRVRQKFADTAFWRADIVTDSKGEAKVSFDMPDNLTTWRATARACTMDTAVGQCTTSVICTKDLLVRLDMPRFLVQDDDTVITALVHNYLSSDQKVTVRLDAPDLKVRDQLIETITVPKDGIGRVEWRVSAIRAGNASLTVYAISPAASDALKIDLPIHPHGERHTETIAGSISNSTATEKLVVRSGSAPGVSEMRIRLSPSYASVMLGSLEYLAKYPYGCTEQTMSCFLPDVIISRTLKSLDIRNPQLEKSLPDMVGAGLNRLYDFQNENGGWGWCEYGEHDLWMTSYVVYGLLTARDAGYEVNKNILDSGLQSIREMLREQKKPNYHTTYAIYVLSLAGRKDEVGSLLAQYRDRKLTSPREIAFAAMIYANLGDDEQAKQYISLLWDKAIISSRQVHWEDSDYWYEDVASEATATALMAIMQITPRDSRVPQSIRWLLEHRRGNHWYSTRDTAMALYVLADYLKNSNELEPDFTATVLVNGRKVASETFNKASLFQAEKEILLQGDEVIQGTNDIEVKMTGSGTLYYTTELTQYLDIKDARELSRSTGIKVRREYHKLVPKSGSGAGLEPSRKSSTSFRTGDVIRVRLIVQSPKVYQHVLVEDYLPAGFESFDSGRLDPWEWSYWWVDQDIRDDRVSFYAETLSKGKNVLEYNVRAGVHGTYHALPVLVQPMYQPDITGYGREDTVKIK